MNVQLTVVQLWALVAGGPIAMVLTLLVGILINNSTTKANLAGLKSDVDRVEGILKSDIAGLKSDIDRVEGTLKSDITGLKSDIARVEGTLNSDITGLKSDIARVEGTLRSEMQRVEGVLGVKLDGLAVRLKALEDEVHSPLVKQ